MIQFCHLVDTLCFQEEMAEGGAEQSFSEPLSRDRSDTAAHNACKRLLLFR